MNAKKQILVTGGAGYIGSHTCKALHQAGYEPITFDNLGKGKPELVKWGPLEKGDLRDFDALSGVFKKYDFKAVVHIAALAAVEESMNDPVLYHDNNVTGSLNLLRLCNDHGVKKIVFSSSAAVYGMPKSNPITEDFPHEPINPYGRTKSIFEFILREADYAHQIKSISLRYFNASGADPECEIGDMRDNPTHVIPIILEAAGGKRKSFTAFGKDYDTPDGTCVRDYIHVADLARAHVLSVGKLLDGAETGQYNLCNNIGTSVLDLTEAVKKVSGKDFPVEIGPRRPGDPDALVGKCEKASDALGWKPEYGDINTIIETAWNWYKKFNG